MKCFLEQWMKKAGRATVVSALVLLAGAGAWAAVEWKDVEAKSAIEAALYRWMPMPASKVLGLRPPREAIKGLSDLIRQQPRAELYSLRALNEEGALDFKAAEADWKKYAETTPDRITGQMALADFYQRRLRPDDEISALNEAGRAPANAEEKLIAADRQRSWQAFERIFQVIRENGLSPAAAAEQYRAWIARYPAERALFARYFEFLLDHRMFPEADKSIGQYRAAFSEDEIFPVKAQALLAYRQGSVEQGLAVYDAHFQPLWPDELVQSYFELMRQTHSLRKYLEHAREAAQKDPSDLNAAARFFYYYQQQGKSEAAQQALSDYRARKERSGSKWSSQELYTMARLYEGVHVYPEAARYYYALYSAGGPADTQEQALNGLANVLLQAPAQNLRLGAGELSMYRDIGTMDPGPGFLNGILSLVLNTTSPGYHYSEEEERANPYFHYAEAAELVRLLDSRFAASFQRPALHARLIEVYSTYGESAAVIRDGRQFMETFPKAAQREQVALLMADAYARTNRTAEESAVYDRLLAELARNAEGVPLGSDATASGAAATPEVGAQDGEAEGTEADASTPERSSDSRRAFNLSGDKKPVAPTGARSPEYSRVLERYLARLVATGQLPQALAVLRKEIDRNPNDSGLYERLAQFLEQNRLGEQQEQVYQLAIKQFQDHSWYHKLARFYLRHKRDADFWELSRQVVQIFSGTELESYFAEGVGSNAYHIRLNEYAHQRFPHDLFFVRALLFSYGKSDPKREALLREYWWCSEDLQNQFFEFLTRTGKLEQELAEVKKNEPAATEGKWDELARGNPVAARFLGEAGFWQSHFEEAAPVMGALTQQFPADVDLGRRTSAVYRSMAAFDPRNAERAVAIEENLNHAVPGDRDTLARIGDILADRELFDRAAPYWNRMAEIRPGEPQAYLEPATVYWDYFNFDAALGLMESGRKKLDNPALYSYEEGAILETRREYPAAVREYVKGALHGEDGARCRNRLLELARRAALREVVNEASASLASGSTPGPEAVKLRLAVLDAQNRAKEIGQLLADVAGRTTSLDLLDWLQETARDRSLVSVQREVLEREVAVTTDPVHRLELRLALVRLDEQKKDLGGAQQTVEALYRDNPKIIGVVRTTVDFYWCNNQKDRAIQVLQEAAGDSYPELRDQYRFEAARKATDAAEYSEARKLLGQLLAGSPYEAKYLAAMADSYAREVNDQGLKNFYLDEIGQFRKAPLGVDARNQQIAALRRSLIPALTGLKDYAGGVDQYIEIINHYPEDDALVAEAALYAQRNGQQTRLLQYYADTAKQSPRDYRWPMVLAHMQAQLEDFPEAIDSFGAAIKIRPDRADFRAARADLLERLMRFDEAGAEYQHLFELNYHAPKWMEKIALLRARQGRAKEAVAALQTAWVDGRPAKPENYFAVARALESWNMLDEAREYAQRGVDATGRDLLAVSEHRDGVELYVRILTRLRQQGAAYERLQTAVSDATSLASSLAATVQQVEKQGVTSLTDQEYHDHLMVARQESARDGKKAALQSMARTAKEYFTPEEKVAFASFLEEKAAGVNANIDVFFLPVAQAAGLSDLEVRWNEMLMLRRYGEGDGAGYAARYKVLQEQRLQFKTLGTKLNGYAEGAGNTRSVFLQQAADAFAAGGLHEAEINELSKLSLRGRPQQHYFDLLLRYQPQELEHLATRLSDDIGYPAAQYAVSHGNLELARKAIRGRGESLLPVWSNANLALAGLYFSDRSETTKLAFLAALGGGTIGERVAHPVNRDQQLAGDVWFYYGSRYGEWLGMSGSDEAEDYLPAILEQAPGSAAGYITTAEYYADAGSIDRALEDYGHALELAPGRADLHDRMAGLYWRKKKREEAIAEWKQALTLLDAQVQLRVVPESFWPTCTSVLNQIGTHHLFPDLRAEADALLRDYIHKNGSYRSDDLLKAAFHAVGNPGPGAEWAISLAGVAPDAESMLRGLLDNQWTPAEAQGLIYQELLRRMQEHGQEAEGRAWEYQRQEVRRTQLRYVRYLIEQKQMDQAAQLLQELPKQERMAADEIELRLWIAVDRKQFDAQIEQYRATPERAPESETLRQVARNLEKDGMTPASRAVLEFVYSREIAAHHLDAPNLLGLADIRLQNGDTAGAVQLLRRLTLVTGEPFENLDAAASLLARTGHHAEAMEFWANLVQSTPWNQRARVNLAQEKLAISATDASARSMAEAVARDPGASYGDRANAAVLLERSDGASLGSGELDALAKGDTTPDNVDKPYYFRARMRAAEKAAAPDVRLRLLEHAIVDTPDAGSPRVPLFYALIHAKRETLALAAIQPVLRVQLPQNYWRFQYSRGENETLADTDQGESETAYFDSGAEADAGGMNEGEVPADGTEARQLPAPERATLALTMAKALAKLEQFDWAQGYLKMAAELDTAKVLRADIASSRNQIRATLRRNRLNASRVPNIHRDVVQDHPVRPRLVAQTHAGARQKEVTQ